MLFELAVIFERPKALHVDHFHPGESLSLATPECHDLTPETVFLLHLGHLGKVFFQLLNLILFGG